MTRQNHPFFSLLNKENFPEPERSIEVSKVLGSFVSRQSLVENISDMIFSDGQVISDGLVSYIYSEGSVDIPDLPGFKPYLSNTPNHWTYNESPGVTDMTSALNSSLNYSDNPTLLAQSYNISTGVVSRQNGGYSLVGEGLRVSELVTSDLTGDLITLTSSSDLILGVTFSGFSIRCTSGTRTSGAFINATHRLRDCTFKDLFLQNCYDGIYAKAPVKCFFTNIFSDQNNIGSGKGRYLYVFDEYNSSEVPSDIHMTNIQASGLNDSGGSGLDSIMFFTSCDGIYISNSHFFNSDYVLRFNPTGDPGEDLCASVHVTNSYFDNVFESHLLYRGTTSSGNYVKHLYSNCDFRDSNGVNGSIDIGTNVPIDMLQIRGSRISQNSGSGIHCGSPSLAKNINVIGTYFKDNNQNNVASAGDLSLRGDCGIISNTTHSGGGALGHSVGLLSDSNNYIIDNILEVDTTTTGISNNGTDNILDKYLKKSITLTTSPQTILSLSSAGSWEVTSLRAAGDSGSFCRVVGGSSPTIVSQNSSGSVVHTYSISGTNLQLSIGSGTSSTEVSIRKV